MTRMSFSGSPKRREDLPQFSILRAKEGSHHDNGYIEYELDGSFDHLQGVREGRGWLLLPGKSCLVGDLKRLNPQTQTAIFSVAAESVRSVVGASFPYLNGYWDAYHVWAVTDLKELWTKILFEVSDSVVTRFEADQVSIIDGREVTSWRCLTPVDPSHPPENGKEILKGGWDHEHCMLCQTHIDPGDYGYRHRDNHWVCLKCYEKYVATQDLSFTDELG